MRRRSLALPPAPRPGFNGPRFLVPSPVPPGRSDSFLPFNSPGPDLAARSCRAGFGDFDGLPCFAGPDLCGGLPPFPALKSDCFGLSPRSGRACCLSCRSLRKGLSPFDLSRFGLSGLALSDFGLSDFSPSDFVLSKDGLPGPPRSPSRLAPSRLSSFQLSDDGRRAGLPGCDLVAAEAMVRDHALFSVLPGRVAPPPGPRWGFEIPSPILERRFAELF